MVRLRAGLSAVAVCLFLAPLSAHADWLDDARAAFRGGDYDTARQLSEPMAEAGDPAALNILGVLHFHGQGVEQDLQLGLDYYEAAVAQEYAIAQANLAWILYKGVNGVPRDLTRAWELADAAAEAGNAEALNTLGAMSEEGVLGSPDYDAAAAYYRQAMDGGSAGAYSNMGALYAQGFGVAQDDTQARLLFEQAAALGNGQGTRNLAYMMELGRGGPQDIPGAIETYRQAIALGYAGAGNDLGILLFNGAAGMAPDPAAAAEAYEQGTALGHDWAPSNLAYLLSDGDPSVPDDIDRAVALYHLAYERGNIEALSDLAYMYWDGVGVAQDHAEARRLLQVLADLGLPGPINDLGYMHEAGLGGPVDFAGALALYQQAARMDYPFAAWGAATVYLNPDYDGADRVEGYAWCAFAITREIEPDRTAEYQESCGTLPDDLSAAERAAITERTDALLSGA
ncbi:hypothetical protein [Nioella sp.]|uniref:SEL1-like repeat protein n=1 Tax=Nioella sp. TaxID=1912091 RepID=UPI003A85BE7C